MSKMVGCKSCGAQVAQGALLCPQCGETNPGVHVMRGIAITVGLLFALRIPHDFRRTAARNMERAGVPRSVAMALGGWRSELMYRRYAIASEADLRDGVSRLASFRKTVARVHQ
jgi:integrase